MKTRLHQTLLSFLSFLTKTIVTVAILATTVYAGTEYFDIDTNKIIQTATVKIFGNLYTSGSVGIGTDTPSERLEVNGNIKLSGVTPSYRLTNVANPVDNYDASNKIYVDTRVGAAGSQVANSYLNNNGSYYSEGGMPYFCRMNVFNGTIQQIISVNQNQLCDATNDLYCDAGSCTATVSQVNNAKTTGIFISARDFRSCSITSGGAYCWGSMKYAQKYTKIVSESSSTCAVRGDGSLYCWGNNANGQFGNGSSTNLFYPTKISNVSGVLDIAMVPSSSSSCILLNNGTIKCAGYSNNGELGDGVVGAPQNTYTLVSGISNAISISAGQNSYCAILSDGTAKCWGQNTSGQLGNNNATDQSTPSVVTGLTNTIKISHVYYNGTSYHKCALISDGTVKCWGANSYGQLGTGTMSANSFIPVTATGITNAIDIVSGIASNCALLADGTVKCWGYGSPPQQLGNGSSANIATPTLVTGITNAIKIKASPTNVCALLADGTVKCWGQDAFGELGDGTTNSVYVPVSVLGISNAVDIFLKNSWNGACALLADGTFKCWGYSYYGHLGDGANCANVYTPMTVNGIMNGQDLTVGIYHACSIQTDGTIKCWGNGGGSCPGGYSNVNGSNPGNYGQLGGGLSTDSSATPSLVASSGGIYYPGVGNTVIADVFSPQQVTNIYAATNITSGNSHSCVIEGGIIKCWGANGEGQLGNGSTSNSTAPVSVSTNQTPIKISAGYMHTCAVFSGGTVGCWGLNSYGQLGNSGTTSSAVPVSATGITTAIDVATSDYTSCAVLSDGTAKCWGLNTMGQVGNNSRSLIFPSPTAVSSLTGAVRITGGQDHFCAVLSDGTAKCWGDDRQGQGGSTISNFPYLTPQAVSGATNIARITAGGAHTCIVKTDGTVACWGLNMNSQLGSTLFSRNATPQNSVGLLGVLDIAAGALHTCVTKSNLSSINCFGDNSQGQSAANSATKTTSPVQVLFSPSSSTTVGGTNYSIAICETRFTSNGNLGGISGADVSCTNECGVGYKFARESELANFPGSIVTRNAYWVDTTGANNCNNWISGGSTVYGTYFQWGAISSTDLFISSSANQASIRTGSNYGACNSVRPLLCVRGIR